MGRTLKDSFEIKIEYVTYQQEEDREFTFAVLFFDTWVYLVLIVSFYLSLKKEYKIERVKDIYNVRYEKKPAIPYLAISSIFNNFLAGSYPALAAR